MPSTHATFWTLALTLTASGCTKPNPLAEHQAEAADSLASDDADGSDELDTDAPPDLADPECDPLPDLELACADCLVGSCCEVMTACGADGDCECLAACRLSGSKPGACQNWCEADDDGVWQLDPLLACAQVSCPDACWQD